MCEVLESNHLVGFEGIEFLKEGKYRFISILAFS